MGILLDLLAARRLLVSDGAWGTMLQARGLPAGGCTEEWNLSHAAEVGDVARQYVQAGSDIVLTNTFGGSPVKLARFGLAERTEEINAAGTRLSIEAAGDRAVVAASVGPTGEFLEPLGEMTAGQMEECFARQFAGIFEAGAQAVCIETMTALDETLCAIRAARRLSGACDIIATMTFDATANGFHTMMGVSCVQAAKALSEAGADIVGANCGNGIENMIPIAAAMRSATGLPILVHANAGLPQLVGGKTVFSQSPADMASRVAELVGAGASIIGGCCGTGPDHIRAIVAEVDKLRS